MNQRARRVLWFFGLYLVSLIAYAAFVLGERHVLDLLH
jgi:hypothetical protein